MALVSVRVRPLGRAEQRQSQHISLSVVAVLAVVEQAEAMFVI